MKISAFRRLVACILVTRCACASAATSCEPDTLGGANVAGAEFNAGRLPGVHARDYIYPGPTEIALLQGLHLRLMRVPFLWERLQPEREAPLDAAELARLDAVVAAATTAGLTIVLDVHNYGAYRNEKLDQPNGSIALSDLWRRLATHYASHASVLFGLMNEPHDIEADRWARIAEDALMAIRATGARNIVLVPGTNWDGAHSWFDPVGKRSNADALEPLLHRFDPVVVEVHQYFDDNFSGTARSCGGAARVPDALTRMARWARAHRVRLMLGEFGVSALPECVAALDAALAVVERDRDVWFGWTYWAAGAWWGSYPFNLQADGGKTPQGDVLVKRADASSGRSCAARP